MPHRAAAAVRAVHETVRVGDLRAAGQRRRLLDLAHGVPAADLARPEVPVPAGKVLDGGEEAAGADDGEVRDAEAVAARAVRLVGVGAVPDEQRVVVAERRARHPQRLEDALVREGAERLARHALDRDGEQRVAGVAVEVLRARPEVERRLARQEIEDVTLRDDVASPAPARHLQQAPLVPNPARVLREMAQRDRHAVVGDLRHVAADVVVPGQAPLAGEERHRQGRELLGDRGDVEDALRGDGDAVLEVGGPVAAGEDDVAALHHRHRAARPVGARPRGEDGVDARFGWGGRSLGGTGERHDPGGDEERRGGQEQGGRQRAGAPRSARSEHRQPS